MMGTDDVTLIYVLGAGHCGSTLLNLLLNGHSQAIGLSEMHYVQQYAHQDEATNNPLSGSFWDELKACWQHKTDIPFGNVLSAPPSCTELGAWDQEKVDRFGQDTARLVRCAGEVAQVSFVVDTSKKWQRLYLLQQAENIDLRVLYLVRDGRAVLNSYLRKFGRFRIGFRRWLAPSLTAFWLRRRMASDHWLHLRYEDLAARPEAELKRVCRFLGIAYEPQMLSFRSHSDRGVRGNRMRARSSETIRLDERWKQELSRRHRLQFAVLGGWLNKLNGY